MSVRLKRQRDGTLRAEWYGAYVDGNKRTERNLNIKWQGTPPASGRWSDPGDPAFEASRDEAEKALQVLVDESGRKGRAEHLTERLIESKTGRAVQYACIADLPARWRNLGREVQATDEHLGNCDAHFRRFINFMLRRNPKAVRLYEVTPEDAAAFVADVRGNLAPATAAYCVRLVAKALSRFLPVGASNPFSEFIGRRKHGESGVIHREPFTQDELRALLDISRDDEFMHPLIVTAACTGMRRGDVCGLQWRDVDLAGGMLTVKTSKTGGAVEIPIFRPLRAVLEQHAGTGRGYVFPAAAAMLRDNADGLSYRFKALVARALDTETPPPPPQPVPAADIEAEALRAISEHVPSGARRDRILDTFRRYANGQSVRQIRKETKASKGTISYDLHAVEKWTGTHFLRSAQSASVKDAIDRVTRVKRETGQKAASVRDWHALRTTFVTLALAAGVPMELVRRVTGHATVEVVLKHYFRPDREQFKAALAGALPDVLTGGSVGGAKVNPADELAALAGKLASGTATKADKARLRKLAAKV